MDNYRTDLNKLVCRYFFSDGCRDGKNCLFPHVKGKDLVPDTVCRYFLKGQCVFGRGCRYDHVILLEGNSTVLLSSADETSMTFPYREEYQAIITMDYMRDCAIYDVVPNLLMRSQHAVFNEFGHPLGYSSFNYANQNHSHLRIGLRCDDSRKGRPVMNSKYTGPLNFDFEPCPYGDACPFQNGNAAFGNAFQHDDLEHRCFDLNVNKNGSLSLSDSDYKTCELCGDFILHKDSKKCQYGLLQNCEHLFCLECILPKRVRRFRKKLIYSNLKIVCPECHTPSRKVISSSISMTYAEKKLLIESYGYIL